MQHRVYIFLVLISLLSCLRAQTIDSLVVQSSLVDIPEPVVLDSIHNDSIVCDEIKKTIKIGHWNIGHFSLGKLPRTTIKNEIADSMATSYRTLIDTLNTDIWGICEYNSLFAVNKYDASLVLFGDYRYDYVGKQNGFLCNAIFSKYKISDPELFWFSQQGRYATICTITIDSTNIAFVETHLDPRNYDLRIQQMHELTERLKDDPYVILCGDFNSQENTEFYEIMDAGYESVFFKDERNNSKNRITWRVVDNIFVKGFEVVSIQNIQDWTKSDHVARICELKIIK